MNFGTRSLIAGVATATVMAVAGPASAASTARNIFAYYNPTNASVGDQFGGALAGYRITDQGDSFTFNFGNASGSGSLTNLYFEDQFSTLVDGFTKNEIASSRFNEVAPGDPPVADTIGWGGTSLEFESVDLAQGLGRVEDRLILTFDYAEGVTFEDVAAVIGEDGFRVATFGITNFREFGEIAGTTGEQLRNPAAGTVSSVPTPTAAAGGLALLGIAGLKRRRNG